MKNIFIISGPSASGKGAIIKALLKKFPDWIVPSSYTTRQPRKHEGTIKKYFYLTESEFKNKIKQKEILEYQKEHGWYFGTKADDIKKAIARNKTIIWEMEPRGAIKMKEMFPDVQLIFIRYPDISSLKTRILLDSNRRNTTNKEIQIRIKSAQRELKYQKHFNKIIINRDGQLKQAIADTLSYIIKKMGIV